MDGEKKAIENAIREVLMLRVARAKTAMEEAQEAANAESKSSAGDKYETGRAMAQNQRDMNARLWIEAQQWLDQFEHARKKIPMTTIEPGSLVKTQNERFYIGPGLGKVNLPDDSIVWVLSNQSPLGKMLMGNKAGAQLKWMGKTIEILEVK